MKKNIYLSITILVLSVLGYAFMVSAGDLEPSSRPAPTMKSLSDIYDALSTSVNPNETLPLPTSSKVEGRDYVMMYLRGETQDEIHGSSTAPGTENMIVVENFSHEVVSPRDAASGLPTGKRQHKPITITKRIDKSTPLIASALVNNENLPTVIFRFYRTSATGHVQQYYTVELVNASIAGIKSGPRDVEEVTFVYQKIIWTWVDGGITAEDDWESPIV